MAIEQEGRQKVADAARWRMNPEKLAMRFEPGDSVMWDKQCGAPDEELKKIIANDGSGPFKVVDVRDVDSDIMLKYGMHPQDVFVQTRYGVNPINCAWFKKGNQPVSAGANVGPEDALAGPTP